VLNQQRKFIYEQRDAILLDADLKKRVNDAAADMAGDMLDEFAAAGKRDAAAALKNLTEQLRTKFAYRLEAEKSELQNAELLEKKIRADLEKDMDDKEALIGAPVLNAIIRDQYLHAIDRKWLDHLENMEALREAVYLRSYAQKNPLTEYKVEGFQIFDAMIADIRQEIASRMHLIRIQAGENREARGGRPAPPAFSASHGNIGAVAGTAGARGTAGRQSARPAGSQPEAATVVRSQPKVGRNDPCPCGSGKKYKHCHGR
jgi:preprotein translocase subunit SecA